MSYVAVNSSAQQIVDAVNEGIDGSGLAGILSSSAGSNQIG